MPCKTPLYIKRKTVFNVCYKSSCQRKCEAVFPSFSLSLLKQPPSPSSATNQTSSVTRGIWFRETSWQPLPEDIAEQVEQEHLAKFEGQPVKYEPPPPPPPPTANDKDSSTPPPPAEKSRKHVGKGRV